jgi:hypothetical protein
MPRLQLNQAPSYRLHRQSGQSIVTFNGHDVLLGRHGTALLGRHGTAETRQKYDRLVAE